MEFKYDTQLLIEGNGLDEDAINDYFTENFKGDCLLAVGDEELIKIHFHTNEPWKVLGYSKVPLLAPETDYETTIGFRTNVVFPTAALRMDDNIIRIYYGAADTVIAFAEAREEDLIQLCLKGE